MKHISIDVVDDQKAKKLVDLLSVLDFVDHIQIDGLSLSSSVDAYQDPRQPFMLKEVAAFEKQHEHLVAQYLGHYVAMNQGKVVDYDTDELLLVDRIEATYPNEVVLIRLVEEQLPGLIYIRSPRWVREE
jgi:hypothetical protein